MAITLDDAKTQLNIELDNYDDDTELTFYVNVANEWMADEVADPTSYRAQLATRLLVAHWWETQRGPAGSFDEAGGEGGAGTWFSIPNKVRELLPEKQAAATTPVGSFPDAVAWPDPVEYTD
jgi:hypothetical protein